MAKVLILVNPATLQILSTKDYICSFEKFSEHYVSYLSEVPVVWRSHGQQHDIPSIESYRRAFEGYDVVVITQHLRVCFDSWINENLNAALLGYGGIKVVFLHDEYDFTEKTRCWLERQNVNLVYTVVPSQHVSKVYPPSRFPKTKFVSILTGYVPLKFRSKNNYKPICDRENLVVYRGRISPIAYGALAKQKENIGRCFEALLKKRHIKADIQWEEARRIYGLDWYRFLETGVATLGTESGSNVFDVYGRIKEHTDRGGSLPGPESLSFKEENLGFKMNQISPRLFEAIGCGTALVLYEGEYSGILQSGEHFIPVKHDHSNLDEVVMELQDKHRVQSMVERTREYMESRKDLQFDYFVSQFDSEITQLLPKKRSMSTKSSRAVKPSIDVGDFSDVCATGIGVFSSLHNDASITTVSLKKWSMAELRRQGAKNLKYHPARKQSLKSSARRLPWISRQVSYFSNNLLPHYARKVVRWLPNRYPILGKLRRKLFGERSL